MTEQNRDEPPRFGGGWDAPGGDEPAPMSLGAWPKPDTPPAKPSEDFAETGPIELPSRLKAVAARWDRPAAPPKPKPKPPVKRFFTPLPEPSFGRPPEPELPSAPVNPAAEVAEPAAVTWLTGRSIFWACLLGVVIGGIAAVLLDVVQLRRAPQMLRTPLINAPPPPKSPQAVAIPGVGERAAPAKGAKRPVPRVARRRDDQTPVYYGPPPRITVLNAPPSVVVLRPSPPAPEPASAPEER